jgi:hypothetical protein
MDDSRFNDIFNGDFDGNYDNIMNRIVDHINYPSYEGSGASIAGAGDDDDGNDADDGNDDDDDDGDDDSDDDDEFIIRRHFDMKKLIICIAGAINMYYINYMHKEPMVSYNTGMRWLTGVLKGHWK